MLKVVSSSLLALSLTLGVSAQAQNLILGPLITFGTNGDGTLRPNGTNSDGSPRQGDLSWLSNDGLQRGLAYNPTSGHLIVVNRNPLGSETIEILDAQTGASLGQLDQSARTISGSANFVYNLVAVADDGAIYVGNLTTAGALVEFVLYRWANEAALQTRVYGPGNPGTGTPSSIRWGDTLAARGSGINTEILVASRQNSTDSGDQAALLRPTDASMATFTSTPLTGGPGDAFGYALTFGPDNTFYTKSASADGTPLYQLAYNPSSGALTVSNAFSTGVFPGRVGALIYQPGSNLLAGIEMTPGTNVDLVRLYSVANQAAPPLFQDRYPVSVWTNADSIFAGALGIYGTNVWALNAFNGIAAFVITNGSPTYVPYIFTQPSGRIVQLTSNAVFSVGVEGTPPLAYQWYFNGAPLAGATTNQLAITNAARTNQGSYTVVVTNNYGSATSSIATLTVLEGYGNLLFYDPFNYPAGLSIIGQGGWNRGSSSMGGDFMTEVGNLIVPYLAPAIGNRVILNQNGSPRTPIGNYTNGVLYFSAAVRLENITASPASETMIAFANGTSTSYTLKINFGATDASLQTYTIGLYKGGTTANGGVATNLDGSPMTFTTNDVVFIVGRYQFNPNASDDTMDMWINPDPSTFGAALPPVPTFGPIGTGVADASKIDNFVLRDSSGFPRRNVDEVRVGFAWADVTPPSPPKLDAFLVGANVKLMWPTNISTGFTLYSVPNLNSTDWQPVTTPVVVQGSSNTVTVSATGSRFFRLRK